ncbi:hypothetical protein VDG64_00675 [Xanthomonas campestris pv. raphani]|uniref:hypothetical protein n=1 Tax=Xanthomonas campestris TaxID=339 RepID=UPI002B235458|nr:hypothetical protein [Xanthomonas campestris]MEA9753722.1 hypothetical protein [Xanthomonas campestris pv. raphani]MEA9955339.1 hypothetical protein [Xanthomonas campestris pv. raphani]MEA9959399.1 hypothetical protein [Xanthomonas campestris pv. raphani]
MRYIFVYQDFFGTVEQLLAELGVTDVEVILVKKGQQAVSEAELQRLQSTGGSCVLIQVERRFKKSLGDVEIAHFIKQFRLKDKVLQGWLLPDPPPEEGCAAPKAAFLQAAADCCWLVFADSALSRADEIASIRWAFVNRAAQLLRRLAMGEQLGPMREWEGRFDVNFANNGQVRYAFNPPKHQHRQAVEWHLSAGKRTTAEAASRIYFDHRQIGGISHVLVFYVGPHPADGTYPATFTDPAWSTVNPPGH